MDLTLIRHGESIWNAENRWQGQADVPLSPRGRLQARAVAGRLFGLSYAARYCSDLARAAETASAIGGVQTTVEGMREIDVGGWSGLRRSEIPERFPEEVEALKAGRPVRIGGGESVEEFEARVSACFGQLAERHVDERVLAVTHGGVIRALVSDALGFRGRYSPLIGVGNTSINQLRLSGGKVEVHTYNDGGHLDTQSQQSVLGANVDPTVRVAIVAIDPEHPADQRLADLLLTTLAIPHVYGQGVAIEHPLFDQILAEPRHEAPARVYEQLVEEHEDGAFMLLLERSMVPELVEQLLVLQPDKCGVLGTPSHGSIAQIRIQEGQCQLFAYGVPVHDPA